MLKLTKTGIGLLTKQYRSVLRKCLLLNFGVFITYASTSNAVYNYDYSNYDHPYELIYDKYSRGDSRINFLDVNTSYTAGASTAHGSYFDLERFAVDLIENIGYHSNSSQYKTISASNSIIQNLRVLDTAIGAKIASDGHYIKKSDTNSITANLFALDEQLYNYYYTFRDDKTSEVIEFAEENDSLSLTEVCHA